MERQKQRILKKPRLNHIRFLSSGLLGAAVFWGAACGTNEQEATTSDAQVCPTPESVPTATFELWRQPIGEESLLSQEDLSELGVSEFNFSKFPGRIRFTSEFAKLLKPLSDRGVKLRIIWIDDMPPHKDVSKDFPSGALSSIPDYLLYEHRGDLSVSYPNEIIEVSTEEHCGQSYLYSVTINHSPEDLRGLADVAFNADFHSEPVVTLVVGLKDNYYGYEFLNTDYYRTFPQYPESIQGIFSHEFQHALDLITYDNLEDPRFLHDFDVKMPHHLRPGEKRARNFAQNMIYEINNEGKIPLIVIEDQNGKAIW